MNIVFFNGKYLLQKDVKIPAYSRSFLLGEGAFTTILVKDGQVMYFDDHIEKLKKDLAFLNLKNNLDIKLTQIHKLIEKNTASKGKYRLRITAFSNDVYLLQNNKNHSKISVLCFLEKINDHEKKAVKLNIYNQPVITPFAHVKTLYYLHRLHIKNFAKEKGFDDAIVLGINGEILETSFSNIFWIKDKKFYFPDLSLPYYCGVTLKNVIKKAKSFGYEIIQEKISIDLLNPSYFPFICNSLSGIIPIKQINSVFYKHLKTNEFSFCFN